MSTTSEYNHQSQANKILVSLNLNVPLQFEIELQTTQSQELNQLNNQESLISDIVLNEINQTKLNEQIKDALYNLEDKSLDKLQEKKLRTIKSRNISNELLSNANEPQSNQQNEIIANKRKMRLADSLNNSLTLTVNLMGTMLRLGKLANYSWE
ncbi:MAG: hypothetical protein AAFX46_13065 [Cyanobacteria bacterium J06636_27]